ncbi:MAG: helix-turn-helix domain-containing protein [Acidobacteriota bacterium]|nr:helix-turn-helix domain-containing protein [Acidobacteriota bacterium]
MVPALGPAYACCVITQNRLAVSVREAAAMLSISPRSVQNFLRLKVLPGRKIGRRTVIPFHALESFLRRDHASPSPCKRANGDDAPAAEIHA